MGQNTATRCRNGLLSGTSSSFQHPRGFPDQLTLQRIWARRDGNQAAVLLFSCTDAPTPASPSHTLGKGHDLQPALGSFCGQNKVKLCQGSLSSVSGLWS